jgi:hypothetical protein
LLDAGKDEMGDDATLVEAIDRLEALTAPSIKAIETTFAALKRTVDAVGADCRAVSETLEALGDALHVITQGTGVGQEWAGFGLVGLPIMGAIRAVKGIAGQYVKQQTGVPLSTWAELVASSSDQFATYLSRLDTVARLSERYHAPPASEIDLEQARKDQEILLDVRWETQAWKQILSRVAQLGQLVDAILQANLRGELGLPEPSGPERPAGFSGSLQRRLKEVQNRTVERSGDLGEWALQSFVEVRDRVRQLPRQTERIAHEVALLEVLLDLEIAEIRACYGEISSTEARIVGMRVAASVILPELAQRLADARQRALEYADYNLRLDGARRAGDVDERVYAILSEEYRKGLEHSRSRLAALEAQADVWRRDGRAVLDACFDWTKLQLDVLDARTLAEQAEAAGDRRILLRRERDRLEEENSVLASL